MNREDLFNALIKLANPTVLVAVLAILATLGCWLAGVEDVSKEIFLLVLGIFGPVLGLALGAKVPNPAKGKED
jgi:hypothetical protein